MIVVHKDKVSISFSFLISVLYTTSLTTLMRILNEKVVHLEYELYWIGSGLGAIFSTPEFWCSVTYSTDNSLV